MSARSDPFLPYAPIRAVGVPHAPFDGVLARDADGSTVLLVDRDELAGWAGWDAALDEHVFSPLDVVRRRDGHDVVFPVANERLDRFLVRRAGGAPLTAGELVTVGVSVLRGCSAVVEAGPDAAQWWLTDDGRPVLVVGSGDADARRASAEVLELAADGADEPLRTVLAQLAADLTTARRPDQFAAAEETLFAVVAPEPLATAVLASVRPPSTRGAVELIDDPAPESRSWWVALASRFDGDLSDLLERVHARVRRARARGPRRRLPLLVGAAAATVVIAGGMLWPDAGDAGADPVATVETSAPVAATPTPPGVETPHDAPADAVLAALLDARRACADEVCRAGVIEDPARVTGGGAIDADPAAREITLVDDLGGLVVLRVQTRDASAPAQLVTIVDTPNGWRVRDVFDVTDPP